MLPLFWPLSTYKIIIRPSVNRENSKTTQQWTIKDDGFFGDSNTNHQNLYFQRIQHGIMGSPEPNKISQVRPHPDCKYTSSTTPRLQISVIGCRVAVPRSHWSAVCLLHLPVVVGLILCISATPHLGTSFPLFHEWR